MIVLDIGANIGVHTLHLAKLVGETGQVLAFEPNPVACEELRRNIALNNSKTSLCYKLLFRSGMGRNSFVFQKMVWKRWAV